MKPMEILKKLNHRQKFSRSILVWKMTEVKRDLPTSGHLISFCRLLPEPRVQMRTLLKIPIAKNSRERVVIIQKILYLVFDAALKKSSPG